MITVNCAIVPRIQPGRWFRCVRACLHGDFGSLAMAAAAIRHGCHPHSVSAFWGSLGTWLMATAFTMQNLRNKDLRMSQYEVALGVRQWHTDSYTKCRNWNCSSLSYKLTLTISLLFRGDFGGIFFGAPGKSQNIVNNDDALWTLRCTTVQT